MKCLCPQCKQCPVNYFDVRAEKVVKLNKNILIIILKNKLSSQTFLLFLLTIRAVCCPQVVSGPTCPHTSPCGHRATTTHCTIPQGKSTSTSTSIPFTKCQKNNTNNYFDDARNCVAPSVSTGELFLIYILRFAFLQTKKIITVFLCLQYNFQMP